MSDNTRNVNRERILKALWDSFPSIYLTLISIIQSVSLGYLAYVVEKIVSENGVEFFGTVDGIVKLLLIGVTFLLLVVVWNEYRMGATVLVWIPMLRDAIIPFTLGIFELLVIHSINLELQWRRQ